VAFSRGKSHLAFCLRSTLIPKIFLVVLAAVAAPISGEGVFIAGVMIGFGYMAFPIPRLVALEVVEGLCPMHRQRSSVTATRIEPSINMAGKMGRAVEPGAGSNKYPADKPIGPVVTVGCAVIGSVVEVPIRAHRLHSNVDGNLGRRYTRTAKEGNCEGCEGKGFDFEHDLSLFA
jgi:hypothetical protein